MPQIKQTCAVTNGSQTVVIAGVNLTQRVKKNGMFMVDALLVPYTVGADPTYDGTNTTVTLTGAYLGPTNALAAGVFVTDFTYPDNVPVIAQGDVGTAAIFSAAMYRLQDMIKAVSPAGLSAYAQYYNDVVAARADIIARQANVVALEASATTSKTASGLSQIAAKTSETSSAVSAAAALASKNAAATSQAAAAASKNAASASETNAATSKAAAGVSEDNAQAWAIQPEDTIVTPGNYSALHHAHKAAASAAYAAQRAQLAADATVNAEAVHNDRIAADASATSAATSESNALASKNAASTSEGNALASKNAAATSESNALSSKSAAQTAKTASETARDTTLNYRDQTYDYMQAAQGATINAVAVRDDRLAADAAAAAAHASELNAASSVSAVNASKNSAAASETNAAGSASSSSTKADQAATSATNAATSESNALASKNAAGVSATNAATSETGALASKNAAGVSATNALASEDASAGNKTAALASETNALASKNAALASENKAKLWADSDMGAAVEPGRYSAKHWATVAASTLGGGMSYQSTWDASTGNFPVSPFKGHVYKVAVAGIIDGENYQPRDLIIYNGTAWDHVDNTDDEVMQVLDVLMAQFKQHLKDAEQTNAGLAAQVHKLKIRLLLNL